VENKRSLIFQRLSLRHAGGAKEENQESVEGPSRCVLSKKKLSDSRAPYTAEPHGTERSAKDKKRSLVRFLQEYRKTNNKEDEKIKGDNDGPVGRPMVMGARSSERAGTSPRPTDKEEI